MNFKNIVFDIGNVVVKFEPRNYLIDKFSEVETENFLFENFFNCEEWLQLDSGEITPTQANSIYMSRAKTAGYAFEMQALIDDWCEMLTPITETCMMINKLKQLGYDIYFLSNISQRALEHLYRKTTVMKLFKGGIASYEVGRLKPDVEIYRALIERYKLDPSISIYVDDLGANIPPAYRLGMHSFQFTDANTLKAKFTQEGIKF